MEVRKCCKCRVEKPLLAFERVTWTESGYDVRCRECAKNTRILWKAAMENAEQRDWHHRLLKSHLSAKYREEQKAQR